MWLTSRVAPNSPLSCSAVREAGWPGYPLWWLYLIHSWRSLHPGSSG